MNLNWKPAIQEALASVTSSVVIHHTLELSHPAFVAPFRLIQELQGRTLKLEDGSAVDFEPAAFKFTLPPVGDNGVQELSIQLDNTDQRISDTVEAVMANPEPITVRYRAYLSTSDVPEMDAPLTLFLSDIRVTETDVTGRASFADIVNRQFLSDSYTTRRFPGLA